MGINLEDAQVPLLDVKNLTKSFGGQLALDHVSLSVRGGSIHALLGKNGAGKSTFIKLLAGAYRADAGEIRIAGRLVDIKNPQQMRKRGISVVHQQANLVRSLTVEENLWLGQRLPSYGLGLVDWKAVRRGARSLLDRVGLAAIDPRAAVQSLRPDTVAMISIAKAAAADANLIILDEPTATLVPQEVAVVLDYMRRLTRAGRGFLFVSHRLQEVFEIADDITVIRDGRVIWAGNRSDINRIELTRAIAGGEASSCEVRRSTQDGHAPHHYTEIPALKTCNLTSAGVKALDLDVHYGEIVGIASLSGGGAEETINALYGRTRIYAGEIFVDGHKISLNSPRDAVRTGIALVPKDRLTEAIITGFPVGFNITIASLAKFISDRFLRFIRNDQERQFALDLSDRLNIKMANINTSINHLSGGNQQKVILARWLGAGSKLLLLNSPTAAVDVGAKIEIYNLLQELASAGTAILFTSTEMEEFAYVCSRVIVLRDGRFIGEFVGSEITEEAVLAASNGEQI